MALIRQVLEAARFAHRHGIVHRDLKPQNVIVDGEGKAVVTDFGIARAGVSEITQTGSVMGTPHYLSPEQAQGFDVTAVSDLYSIGVMLYEALTGRVPFEGDSAVAVAMKQVSQTPQRPSSINPRVSPALDAVVMRALEKDPGERFQSADAFIAALDAAMSGAGRHGRRHRRLRAAAAGGRDPGGGRSRGARPRGGGAQAPPPLDRRRLVAAVLIGLLVGFALTRDTTTDVPDVTGNELNVAIALLQQDGFSVGDVKRVEREAPPNTVLEQDPPPRPPADKASLDCSFLTFFCSKPKVTLTVSAGPGSGKVPATAGLPRGEATEKLEAAGFGVRVETVNSDSVEEGLVIHSEPSAGKTATHGSDVTLFVSAGPKLAKVPVLVGTQRAVAVQQIRGRGLDPRVSEEESTSPAGEVIRQSPSAGSRGRTGLDGLDRRLQRAKQEAKVPNVIGKLRSEAVQAMRAAGLSPTVEEEETEVPGKVGRVIDQFPPPGSEVEAGRDGDDRRRQAGRARRKPEEEEP